MIWNFCLYTLIFVVIFMKNVYSRLHILFGFVTEYAEFLENIMKHFFGLSMVELK